MSLSSPVGLNLSSKMNLLIIRIAFLAATAPGLFFVTSDLTNIRIADDTTSIWVLKANESDFPSSAADYDDSSDLYTTTEQAVSQDEPLTRQDYNTEDLSATYTPGYCRCINKYYCTGPDNKILRKKRAVNTPPCRNRDEVMCCLTTGPGCGVPANFPYFQPYPLYGEANYGDYPWTALIMDTNNQLIYGLGIVVSWGLVLTTARNVQSLTPNRNGRVKVRLGEWDLSSGDEPFRPQEYEVKDIVIHPQFNPRTYQNDIAILRLKTQVDLSSFPSIRSACIAKPNDLNKFEGAKCLVAGWGTVAALKRIQNTPSATAANARNILKEVDMQVIDGNICQDALRRNVGDPQFILDKRAFMCAGGEAGKGLCRGDEGGALVCKDRRSERLTVVGMASWATTCGQAGLPGVFTNIANYYDWIRTVEPNIGQ